MRRLRLSVVCLFAVAAPALLFQNVLPGFVSSGQTAPALSAPTGLVASDGSYSTKVGLTWDAVRGATLYRIFRSTTNDPSTAVGVGTTAAGAFFDTTAAQSQTFFYWVRAENGTNFGPLSAPDQGTRAAATFLIGPLPPLNPPPAPAGNQVTAAKAFLGKALFWDEQLSSTRTVSCGTCHFASSGGSDPRTVVGSARSLNPGADNLFNTADDVNGSPGVPSTGAGGGYALSPLFGFGEQVTPRKSKPHIEAAYSPTLFWDGRAGGTFTDPLSGAVVIANGAALENQVIGPPLSPVEMAHAGRDWNDVAARVASSKPLALSPGIPAGLNEWIGGRTYPELFAEAFGTPGVTPARIALAVATFERTLFSDRTPFDAATAGVAQLSAAETRGLAVFRGQGRCVGCHAGTLFSDNQFHNIGLRPQSQDPGRFAVTNNINDLGMFRTPSLRNVGLRAPYFHTGQFATLEEVVEFYNRGGDFAAPNINPNSITTLGLSAQQRADLVAFLRGALTDPRVATGQAPFDRPLLYAESTRVPLITGTGAAGSGGAVPRVTAVEPPVVGNPRFTVGVSNALGGAQAVLVIDREDPGAGPNVPPSGSFARVGVQLNGTGAGQGSGSVGLDIPDSAALVGQTFFGRWYVTDPGAQGGVAVTPAFRMTVFGDASPAANQLDADPFFVAQHYRDFLGREPDESGLAFWQGSLAECFGAPACVEVRRVNVSAAFFLSIEFQETGFYAIRLQRAAFGHKSADSSRLTRAAFLPDAQELSAGVIVGPGDEWRLRLEQNKAAYAERVAASAEFAARFPATLTAGEYVAALYNSAGVTPAQGETDEAVTAFGAGGAAGRAAALAKVADSQSVTRAELNPAFVLMEYFGYLRRDPDVAGYDFWLAKLEQFGGDFVAAEMVKAFLSSTEYRARFGTP